MTYVIYKYYYVCESCGERLDTRTCLRCLAKQKLGITCGSTEIANVLYGYNDIKWIPFDELKNIKYLADSNDGRTYKANWGNKNVILKVLCNPRNTISRILNELNVHKMVRSQIIKCCGITRYPNTNEYGLVFDYVCENLHNHLLKNFKEITWKNKVEALYWISRGLKEIHSKNYIHRNLHSGNIFSGSCIGDLKLCQPININEVNEVYGVIPYLAPEVLSGWPYTKKSDIYSFGMIMWEYTSGKKPFHDRAHDCNLILNILGGERPDITDDTPEFYSELMKKCWGSDPEKRPTIYEIEGCLDKYYHQQHLEPEAKRQEIIKSKDFLSKEKKYRHHPRAIYSSYPLSNLIRQASLKKSKESSKKSSKESSKSRTFSTIFKAFCLNNTEK